MMFNIRYNLPVLTDKLRKINRLFWYKYTVKYKGQGHYFYTELESMRNWCWYKFGPDKSRWGWEWEWLKKTDPCYDVTFKFKRREDYALFVLSNT